MKMTYRGSKNAPLNYDEVDQNFKNFEDFYKYTTSYATIENKNDDPSTIELDISKNQNFHIKTHANITLNIKYDAIDFDTMREITVSFNRTANAYVFVNDKQVISDAESNLIKFYVFISSTGYQIFFN